MKCGRSHWKTKNKMQCAKVPRRKSPWVLLLLPVNEFAVKAIFEYDGGNLQYGTSVMLIL